MKTCEQVQQEWEETLTELQEAVHELKAWKRPNRWSDLLWNSDFSFVQEQLLILTRLRGEFYILSEMKEPRLESSAEGGGST